MSVIYIQAKVGEDIVRWELDATLTAAQSYRTRATDFRIESGSNVSDNIVNSNAELNVKGVLTNVYATLPTNGEQDPNKVATYIKSLKKLRNSKQPFTVRIGNELFPNSVFTSLNIDLKSHVSDTVSSYAISFQTKQLRFGERARQVTVKDVVVQDITSEKEEVAPVKQEVEERNISRLSTKYGVWESYNASFN